MDLFISRTSTALPRYLLPYATFMSTFLSETRRDLMGVVVTLVLPSCRAPRVLLGHAAHAFHLPPKLKSSNNVTLSAFVQTPTLPASEKLVSSASITLAPSKVTVK